MAKEWYLLDGKNSFLTGTCCDSTSFLEENFLVALESSIGTDVELYNYDLSECTQMRAIVQNVVQDTKLKTQSRQMLVPIGSCKAGMYFKYKNRYWLIVGMVDDNKMYEKAIVTWCNYLITWVNGNGAIIQRWANVSSASQYNNGETYTDHYRTRTDQLMILTPDDDESILLDSGKRFIIDQRCKVYEKNFSTDVTVNTECPVTVYRLTRPDSVLFDYNDSGYHEFMVYQDEQHDGDGYYVIDGKGYWLCDQPTVGESAKPMTGYIEYDSLEIYDGLEPGEFTAKFVGSNGCEVDVIPVWNIDCEFKSELDVTYIGNAILISVDNPKLVNKSFELFLSGNGYASTSVTVMIKAFL